MRSSNRALPRTRAFWLWLAVAAAAGLAGWWVSTRWGTDARPAVPPAALPTAVATPAGAGSDVRTDQAASLSSAPMTRTDVQSAVSSEAPPQGVATLTVAERLGRSAAQPGVRGLVRGTTGVPSVSTPAARDRGGSPAQDFPFTVAAFLGAGQPPYAVGSTIAVRIPVTSGVVSTASAGTPALHFSISDVYPPSIAPRQDLYVFVRDQGQYLGGNAPDRVVASSPTDVFTVEGDVVRGQGQWAGYAEPRAAFERHVTRP